MTDDELALAKRLCEYTLPLAPGYVEPWIAQAHKLLPKLVAEIERLKADFDEYRRGATRTDDQG